MNFRLAMTGAAVAGSVLAALGLYWKGRLEGATRERPKVEAAQAEAAKAGLEIEGARQSAARIDVVTQTREAASRTIGDLAPAVLKSEDANVPLDPDRATRLLHADRELCRLAPELDGCRPSN